MKDYAKTFYLSTPWIRTRTAYKKKTIFCERCAAAGLIKPGIIVHHIKPITPGNLQDVTITLSEDNLMLLCRDCHAAIHSRHPKRYQTAADGSVRLYND